MRSALLTLSLTESSVARPVFPGDHPDPTILRVGQHFWASATSGEWGPQFPLFHSTDLMHWTPQGAIFPVQPAWAEGSFWAPELVEDGGRFFVYYVARARGGPLSIAVATATSPKGPWIDHGPILAEPLGSIDPAFVRDEHGQPYLVSKTDGNSQRQPTPISARRLTPDLLHVTGAPTQLITNDQPWEGGVVEGPYVLRRAHRFYLFYAGNDCCGRECKYAEGVARADHLLGPWTKFPGNPIINANQTWRCPGHGTAVRGATVNGEAGADYLLYHAYPESGTVYVGRQAILDQVMWTEDGWPTINAGAGPGAGFREPRTGFRDDFREVTLNDSWQWPVNTAPLALTGLNAEGEGALHLRVPARRQSALLAVPIPGSPHYVATVRMRWEARGSAEQGAGDREQPETPTYNAPPTTAWTGLSVVGDPFNTIGLGVRGRSLELWVRRGATQHVAWSADYGDGLADIWLQVQSQGGAELAFRFSKDGQTWTEAAARVDASGLPAWDHGLRIGFMLEGPEYTRATFQHFALEELTAETEGSAVERG